MTEARDSAANDERARKLKEAGYTSPLGAIVFCLLVAGLGGVLGSIYLAIAFNAMFGMESESLNSIAGAAAGALVASGLAFSKIWQGNLEARAKVDDVEWQKLARELRSRIPRNRTR